MRPLGAFALGLAAITLTACGARKEEVVPRTHVTVRIAMLAPNAGEAPIYAAAQAGHFSEAGLTVAPRESSSPLESLSELGGGSADLAISTEPAVLEARDRGLKVVSVAALVPAPLSSAIWLPTSGIKSARDFTSKRVGTLGLDYQQAFAQTLARNSGAAGTIAARSVGADPTGALESRRVDAVVGAYTNQTGVELAMAGRQPAVVPVADGGVPTFDEFVVVAREDTLRRERDVIRSFLGALVRATHDLVARSPQAVGSLIAAERGIDPRVSRTALDETLPLLVAARGQPYGYQDPTHWAAFGAWMRANALLARPPSTARAFTNRLLPGGGL